MMNRLVLAALSLAVLFLFGVSHAAQHDSPFAASSITDALFSPEFAFDNDPKTRWASATGAAHDEWIQIDFGRRVPIHALTITWENAYALDYELQTSDDASAWTTIFHQTEGPGGTEELKDLKGKGRYLRILCHKPTPFQLYSIWDISFPDGKTAKAFADVHEQIEKARLEATRAARQRLRDALRDSGAQSIVFATRPLYDDGHWYANISYYAEDTNQKTYAKGGGLYLYSVAEDAVKPLIEDPEGTVRDPAVNYDGSLILFSWRKGGTDTFHLYTIAPDGTNLKQLTFGEYDDFEPAWLPDGGIAFVSSRCRRWVNCWLTQVAVVHRCNADGTNILPLSANLEQDNTPWPMPDGRILYTRWEYVDRSQVDYHHLWTMNPDGTAQQVFFGNYHPGGLYIDAKPVPDSPDVVFINSAGHGAKEHTGRVALVNAKQGPDALSSIRNISGDGYRDPYPITTDVFLAAHDQDLVLLGADGTEEPLFKLPASSDLRMHEPRPIAARPIERTIPSRVDYTQATGRLILSDVYKGRNMEGVARGDIKRLLVLESLPKPINYTGGMDPLSYGGTFTLERVLGTIPVEEDGSAYMELPANRALLFVALDGNGNSVKRMQSFCSVMPGETTSCVGCHEPRTETTPVRNARRPIALNFPPRQIKPVSDVPDVYDFPRDIQPILDKHCVRCHDYDAHPDGPDGPRAGGVILTGDHGPMYSHSYATLTVRRQFVDGRDQPVSNLAPRTIGTGASPLMTKVQGGHHGVKLSDREIMMVRLWIETGAAYPGTYAALGSGCIGGYRANTPVETDDEWPASKAAAEVIDRRCASCHEGERRIPRNLSDENDLSFWRPEWNDPRLMRSRHLVFNLTRPDKSMIVMAPLAKEAGGFGICQAKDASGTSTPLFANASDPDYQKLLAMCTAGKERLAVIKRFDMPGFQPPAPYFREMQRYGILPADLASAPTLDPYQLDRAYWNSFHQSVALKHPAYAMQVKHTDSIR
ncbi:MAG: discoidin domain-containing protein [Candidatus Hydrogenedentes bacterium]|nr:discoidin domain-containing protein [Candidatus Hydrogenedentota bacterium]